jgi:hypothetical protein
VLIAVGDRRPLAKVFIAVAALASVSVTVIMRTWVFKVHFLSQIQVVLVALRLHLSVTCTHTCVWSVLNSVMV